MIYAGGKEVKEIYAGGKPVQKVYAGGKLVWEAGGATTYTYHFTFAYSSGSMIYANGANYATVEIQREAEGVQREYCDATVTLTTNPSSTFTLTRTDTGKYKITAGSRKKVTGAEISGTVKAEIGTWSQTATVKQQKNEKTVYGIEKQVTFVINSAHTYGTTPASASGASWTATATGMLQTYITYEYTSGEYDTEADGLATGITQSQIDIDAIGFGITGSGKATGTLITFANMGRSPSSGRMAYIYAKYKDENGVEYSDYTSVYQAKNELLNTYGYAITYLKLNNTDGNITIPYLAQQISVSAGGTYKEEWDSGTYTGLTYTVPNNNFSVTGTGFSYSAGKVSVAYNSGSQRIGTVYANYQGQSLSRTITQEAFVVDLPLFGVLSATRTGLSVLFKCSITSTGGGTISAVGFEWGYTSSYGNTESLTPVQSGNFQKTITVEANKTLYYRAYAENEAGTAYTAGTLVIPATPNVSLRTPTWQQGIGVEGIVWLNAGVPPVQVGDLIAYGFEYSANSDLSGSITVYSSGVSSTTGYFTQNVNWTLFTRIYFRAFAENDIGRVYTEIDDYRPR